MDLWKRKAVVVPEAWSRGAESLVRRAAGRWDQAYAAVSTALVSCSLGEEVINRTTPRGDRVVLNQRLEEMVEDTEDYWAGWNRSRNGWWVGASRVEVIQARALCGLEPCAFAKLSVGDLVLLNARGVGVYAAAIDGMQQSPCFSTKPGMSKSDMSVKIAAWAGLVPGGATVLLAFVGVEPAAAAALLNALAEASIGVPITPPAEFGVFAAVGRKGDRHCWNTHAANDLIQIRAPHNTCACHDFGTAL